MTFEHPLRLLLLVVPLVLAGWEIVRRRHRVALPIDGGVARSGRSLARLVLAAGLLPSILLAIAIVVFARPLKPDVPRQQRELTNVELLLDVSGSMTAEFGKGSRYDGAMEAIHQFTQRRQGDALGLTVFGNDVLEWTPLTTDLAAIESAGPWLDPKNLPSQLTQSTMIGTAVRFCHQGLVRRGQGDRMIVLVTDGASSDIGDGSGRMIAADLAADGIVLHAIFVGDGPTPRELYDLSRPTKGQVFMASNPESLSSIFEQINRMTPVKLKPIASRLVDAFGPFSIAGLALLAIYQLSLLGLRYTPW